MEPGRAVRSPRGMEAEPRKLVENNYSLKDSDSQPLLYFLLHIFCSFRVEPDELWLSITPGLTFSY